VGGNAITLAPSITLDFMELAEHHYNGNLDVVNAWQTFQAVGVTYSPSANAHFKSVAIGHA